VLSQGEAVLLPWRVSRCAFIVAALDLLIDATPCVITIRRLSVSDLIPDKNLNEHELLWQ
jgi:hypothetical protein